MKRSKPQDKFASKSAHKESHYYKIAVDRIDNYG